MIFYSFKFGNSCTLTSMRVHEHSAVKSVTTLDKQFCVYSLASLYCLSYRFEISAFSRLYVRVNYSMCTHYDRLYTVEYFFYVSVNFFRFCSLPTLTWVTRMPSDVSERRYRSFNAPYSEYVFKLRCSKHFCNYFN